jgi:hypothetical protein
MTSQELEAACTSFVNELGLDPSLCTPSLFPGSGGSGGTSSYAIEPQPGVILVVDPKLWNCGFGIYVVPGSACPKRNKGHVLGILGGEPPSWEPPPPPPRKQRQASTHGSRKRCVWAQRTLEEANDALTYLRDLQGNRSAWGPDGNLLDSNVTSVLLEKALRWEETWFTREVYMTLVKRFPNHRSGSELYWLHALRMGWELTKDEVEKELKSPACDTGTGGGRAKS